MIAAAIIDVAIPEIPLEASALWLELQATQVRELNARLLFADQSDHFSILTNHPDVIVEAIEMVVGAVHDPGAWATPEATPAP